MLVIVMVFSLSSVGCASAPQTGGPAVEQTPGSTSYWEMPTVASGEVYEWTLYTASGPGQGWQNTVLGPEVIPDIERITNGRLKIEILYPGEHPYKASDLLGAVSRGECQMVQTNYPNASYEEPILGVCDLPFLQPPGGHTVKKDMHRLLAPLYEEILNDWNVFEMVDSYNPPQQFWHVDKWLEDFDSMKGEKIRTWSPDLDNVITMMNGTPVRVDSSEAYTALQTGLIDGLITGTVFCISSKFPEVVKHFQPLDVFQTTKVMLVNNDAWNELPKDIQDAVMKYWGLRGEWFGDGEIREEPAYLEFAADVYGLETRAVPAGFREEIVASSYEGIWKAWVERSGEGAAETLDTVVAILQAAGYEVTNYPS